MSKIKDTKDGRKNGGHTRLFNNIGLGQLISQTHGTSIRNGNELEKIISSFLPQITIEDLNYIKNGLFEKCSGKKYILNNNQIVKTNFFKKRPDFMLINIEEKKVIVFELKDGDTFDTKKAQGEINNLNNFVKELENNIYFSGFEIDYRFCSFSSETSEQIIKGMKNLIEKSKVMTGKELLLLFNINYKNIFKMRKKDVYENKVTFIERLFEITSIRKMIFKYLTQHKVYSKQLKDLLNKNL